MAKRLLNDFPEITFSVSATTRPPRKGEIDGKDYHFLSREEFLKNIEKNDFLEWEEFYNGIRYGTLKSDVENQLNKGYFVLLDIDVLGALNVKKIYGDEALSIFISPPSMSVLKNRLKKRGTETEESLQTRIERAADEIEYADRFDKVVVNDNLEKAYTEIKTTVQQFLNS